MDRIPVLLDTDPGSDIDDALAIAYLLRQPRCELLGITTVTGDVAKRASIVEVLCRTAGRAEVPIVAGRRDVLAYGPGQPNVPQFEVVAKQEHHLDYKPDQAVDFLRRRIRERPGEVVLATIGPFSNIAILFALDPEIPSLLRGLVSMAGAFTVNENSEWNCICDPAATAIVAHTPRPHHAWYGLDVTLKVHLSHQEVEKRFKGPLLEAILPMAKVWFQGSGDMIFHDPLAVANIFEPNLSSMRKGKVSVEPSDGKTFFTEGPGADEVAHEVDGARFLDHFFKVV